MSELHNCFVSYKFEDYDQKYAVDILDLLKERGDVGKGMRDDKEIESDDLEYVMQRIREKYMNNTTVTIFLIGEHSSENEGNDYLGRNKQAFIIKELQATLYNGKGNPRDGLLGIVLPNMYGRIYGGTVRCGVCGSNHSIVNINDGTVIREFSNNYYLHSSLPCKTAFAEEDRYCVLATYDDFMKDPDSFIDLAFEKTKQPIAGEVHWRNLRD
jgi:MTH538 TIR-like domain (DUF1863).